jgi:hypothetical protein
MVTMGIEHYNQSRVITFTLEISNALFTTIFSLGTWFFYAAATFSRTAHKRMTFRFDLLN